MITSKDIAPLLKKLDSASPYGENLTHSTIYDDIKKLRGLYTPDLPQGVWQEDVPKADWYRVAKICTHLLAKESKDLQVALWLTEAWFYLHGLPGFLYGTLLVHGLLKNFWDHLYPQCEDPSERIYLFDWFSQTMENALLTLAICRPQTPGLEAYTFANYIDARHLNTVSQKQKDPERFLKREGRPLKCDVEQSITDTQVAFYETLEQNLHKVKDALEQLEGFFNHCAHLSESLFSSTTKRIEDLLTLTPSWHKKAKVTQPIEKKGLLNTLKATLTPLSKEEEAAEPTHVVVSSQETEKQPLDPVVISRPSSRADAYILLKDVATYLKQHDPQSPVPYLLERIYTWEHKTFPEITHDFTSPAEAAVFLGEFFRKKEKSA